MNTIIKYNTKYNILLLVNKFLSFKLLSRIKLLNNAEIVFLEFDNVENVYDPSRAVNNVENNQLLQDEAVNVFKKTVLAVEGKTIFIE